MPNVMTTNAVVVCPHGGVGTPQTYSKKCQAHGGGYIHAEGDTGKLACPFIPSPCGGYQLRSMHLNATTIDGRATILVTDFNQTLTGLPLTITEVHETFDNTTPAPLPPGATGSALSPALLDESPPVVTVAPPAAAIVTAPSAPPPIIVAFNLFSPFPLRWLLFEVDEVAKLNVDLSNGFPGMLVAPAGGAWDTPALTVTLTLTSPLLFALLPGRYHFFMTGVTERGVNKFAEFVLTKT